LAATASLQAAPPKPAIVADIERAMAEFGSPAIAVSVVYDGDVYYSAGHGIVEVDSRARVDDRTLFQIGSVSKAFTTAAVALLVDAGKLRWNDPVIDHLPEFRLHDPWVTREFTIRDLLTHRSGLPLGAGDLLMFPDGNATPAEVIHALRYFEPATSFRSEFAYDNLLYIVAGEVVARVSGEPFADFLEKRLFAPLGMNECVATPDRAAPGAEIATPHMSVDGELEITTTRVTNLVAAAGGIACSARGMARWMAFMLGEGTTADGAQLISAAQFAELTKPVTLLPAPGYLAEHAGTRLNAYALGWGVSTFYGEPMLSHSGGVWGVTTFIALMPEQKLAVFASNNQMSAAPRAVVNDIVDAFLEDSSSKAGKDWVSILASVSGDRGSAAQKVVDEAWAARDADSTPSLPLEAYTGTYRDPWYGTIRISLEDGRLKFESDRNEPLQGPLEHFQHDTFVARWADRRLHADAYVSFLLGPAGDVERIRMQAVSPATDFSYDFHDLDLEIVDERPLERLPAAN
jgi:CubicO group peptidase (beta-lactamase class C family)